MDKKSSTPAQSPRPPAVAELSGNAILVANLTRSAGSSSSLSNDTDTTAHRRPSSSSSSLSLSLSGGRSNHASPALIESSTPRGSRGHSSHSQSTIATTTTDSSGSTSNTNTNGTKKGQSQQNYHYSPPAALESQLAGLQQRTQQQQHQAANLGILSSGSNSSSAPLLEIEARRLMLPATSSGSGFSSWMSSPAVSVDGYSPSIGDSPWFSSQQAVAAAASLPSISPIVASLLAQHLSPSSSPALLDAAFSPHPGVNAAGLSVIGRSAYAPSTSQQPPPPPSARPISSFLPQRPEQRAEPL
jgi:hypothetical protein